MSPAREHHVVAQRTIAWEVAQPPACSWPISLLDVGGRLGVWGFGAAEIRSTPEGWRCPACGGRDRDGGGMHVYRTGHELCTSCARAWCEANIDIDAVPEVWRGWWHPLRPGQTRRPQPGDNPVEATDG